jgi:hypothetical protein
MAVDFGRDIRPIFAAHCHACHGLDKQESGLRLDRKENALAGGDSGRAIDPNDSAASRLIQYVAGMDPDRIMPPEGPRLTANQVSLLRAWIDQGADWPAETDAAAQGLDHWSFRPPVRHESPAVRDATWVRNPIDSFVLARLESAGIAPSPEADRPTLIRRLSLDLLGLPPSPEEVAEFLADDRSDAYERLVDRMLASPHYGERWGRYWLDLARYADSNGYDNDEPRPDAWRWRDWVIDATNRDLPFDQFTLEQLAGDLLPEATFAHRLATGFHRNTPLNTESGVDREEFRVRTVVDRINTTGTVWLGLTIGCAQCHSHKYDPLTHREYYRLLAFFDNVDEVDAGGPDGVKAPVRAAAAAPRATHVLLRGDHLNPADEVAPGVPAVLHPLAGQGRESQGSRAEGQGPEGAEGRDPAGPGPSTLNHQPSEPSTLDPRPSRIDLARWLMDPANPLTARVTVNRIWQHLFGRGLVATELVLRGWRQKEMIRLVVRSATYRQSSTVRADLAERDPENLLLARQNRFRLDGELVRDAALAAAGLLDRRIGGPSFYPALPPEMTAGVQWQASPASEQHRRGMYICTQRALPYPMLATFDSPDSHVTCTQRDRSNTPLQALIVLNDAAFFECAQALGRRVLERPGSTSERIGYAFQVCFARGPDSEELARLERLLQEQLAIFRVERGVPAALVGDTPLPDGTDLAEAAAWIGVARALLNLDEFLTRE